MRKKKDRMKDFFKKFTLFDILYLSISWAIVLTVSLLCKTGAFTIVFMMLNIASILLLAKGFVFAPIAVVVAYTMYAMLSYHNGLYGETIVYGAVLIPLQIRTTISWQLKQKKDGKRFIISKIKPLEWLILGLVSVGLLFGIYFLLRVFNTSYLILSTILFVLSVTSNYLLLRRTEYAYIEILLCNAVFLILWLMPFIEGRPGGVEVIPVGVCSLIYVVNNVKGFINWRKIRKRQMKEKTESFDKEERKKIVDEYIYGK